MKQNSIQNTSACSVPATPTEKPQGLHAVSESYSVGVEAGYTAFLQTGSKFDDTARNCGAVLLNASLRSHVGYPQTRSDMVAFMSEARLTYFSHVL